MNAGVERRLARRVEERPALLLAQLEGQVDVLRDLARLEGQPVVPALGELLGVRDEFRPGRGRPADARRGELGLVVVQAVGRAVERDGGRRLAGRAGGRQAAGQEPAGAADLVHDRRGERQEGAGGLERCGPGVADVQDVGALARHRGRRDLVEQGRPRDHLDLDLDAGLLGELGDLRGQDLLVVLQAGALVAGPVGERRMGGGTGVRAAAAAGSEGRAAAAAAQARVNSFVGLMWCPSRGFAASTPRVSRRASCRNRALIVRSRAGRSEHGAGGIFYGFL